MLLIFQEYFLLACERIYDVIGFMVFVSSTSLLCLCSTAKAYVFVHNAFVGTVPVTVSLSVCAECVRACVRALLNERISSELD